MPNRKKNRKKNRQPFFTRPLTGKTYKKEFKAARRQEFRPISRQIQGEKRAEKETRRRMGDYFDSYGKAVEKTAKTASTSAALTKQSVLNQADRAQAVDESVRQKLDAEARADAEKRGTTYTPTNTGAAASSSRRVALDTFGALMSQQANANNAYLADKGRIGEGERRSQLIKSRARSRSLNADKRDVAKAKQDFARDHRSRARETERQFYLEQQALADSAKGRRSQMKLAKQYGKNEKKAQNRSLRNQLAVNAAQGKNAKSDDRRSRKYAKKFGGSKGGGGGGGQKVPPADKRRASAYLRSAPKNAYSNPKSAVDYLINRGISPAAARAAVRNAKKKSQASTPKPQFDKFH